MAGDADGEGDGQMTGMKKQKKWLLFWILAFLTVVLIFSLSDRDAAHSTDDSSVICRFLAEHFIDGFEDYTPAHQKQILHKMQHPVRKTAHMMEYALLGGLFCMALGRFPAARYPGAWILAVACAALDEYHQTFVPGRSGELRDIAIDSAGALAGILFLLLLRLVWHSLKHRKPIY